MQFRNRTTVHTADDREVGRVVRVVINPDTKEVTHIVVRKGILFREDKVIPLDLVADATEDRVSLREDAGDLEELPPFEETHYILTDEERAAKASDPDAEPPALYWYPPLRGGDIGYPGLPGTPLVPYPPPYMIQTEQHIPEGTVALQEGARVFSADERQVGNVSRVFTETSGDRATHFLVSEGVLSRGHKLIPAAWIRELREKEVYLSVAADVLDRLPEYKG